MTSSDSATVELAASELQGVWIHDPDDPAGTIEWFAYGGIGRGDDLAVDQTLFTPVGRTYPLAEFGDSQTRQVDVTVTIPRGTDEFTGLEWRAQYNALLALVQLRKTLCYRDNRGRRLFGTVASVKGSDIDTGNTLTISVNQVDYDEAA